LEITGVAGSFVRGLKIKSAGSFGREKPAWASFFLNYTLYPGFCTL
jgi:hypothetical protein